MKQRWILWLKISGIWKIWKTKASLIIPCAPEMVPNSKKVKTNKYSKIESVQAQSFLDADDKKKLVSQGSAGL